MTTSSIDLIISTSRAGAEAFVWLDPFAVVSITDPESIPARLRQHNVVARCDLQFWDLLADVGDGRIFDAVLAKRVVDFVRRECSGAKLLLVHCEAGISRSTAMAAAFGAILNAEVRHQNSLTLNPNSLVMRLVLEAAGLASNSVDSSAFSEYRDALERRLRVQRD